MLSKLGPNFSDSSRGEERCRVLSVGGEAVKLRGKGRIHEFRSDIPWERTFTTVHSIGGYFINFIEHLSDAASPLLGNFCNVQILDLARSKV